LTSIPPVAISAQGPHIRFALRFWYTHSRVLLFSRILKVIVCGADLVMAGRVQTSYRRWPMAIPKLSAF
ncbi:MAG: hypothetical protein WBL84_05905, partial [Xanthobacteraceae bacterium]